MTISELDKQISNNTLSQCYLFYGEEDFLMRQKAEQVKKIALAGGLEDFNLHIFEGKKFNISEAADAIESFPQMSERKLVIFKNTEVFKAAKGDVAEFFESILPKLPPYTHIIVMEPDIDKRKKGLLAAFDKVGGIVAFDHLKPNQLSMWLESMFDAEGKRALTSDIAYMVSISSPSMAQLKNEFDKIINYVGTREKVTREDIDAVMVKSVEFKIFALIDNIVARKTDGVFADLKEMKDAREPAIIAFSLVLSRLGEILMAKLLTDEGLKFNDIKSYFEPQKQWLAGKTIDQSRAFSAEFLRKMLEYGAELDYSVKIGKINDYAALEIFAVAISGNLC